MTFVRVMKNCGVGFLLLLIGGGCDSRLPSEYRSFFAQPPAQQREQFRKLPVDEQLKIYRHSTTLHPPDPAGLWPVIAERGKESVPFLLQALHDEQDEVFKRHIVAIFLSMSWNTYDLRGDEKVLSSLETAVASIRKTELRENAEKLLSSIKVGPGPGSHSHH